MGRSVFIILFANLSYKEVRATVMGIGQIVGGVARFLVRNASNGDGSGPLLVPALYSWSCKQHSWLFNSDFTFYVGLGKRVDSSCSAFSAV